MLNKDEITFIKYLKSRKNWIFLNLLISFLFCINNYAFSLDLMPNLYAFSLDLMPNLYAFILSSFIISIYFLYDFYLVKRKEKKILFGIDSIEDILISPLDSTYEYLINDLKNQIRERESNLSRDYIKLKEYYTIWTHQIKTPISSLYLLIDEDDRDKEDLKEEVFKIEEYVDMLIGYLRLGSKSNDYVFANIDLDELIKKSIRKYSYIFIRKKIRIEFLETNIYIFTDRKWISFIIDQLLSNALKYTDEGSIKIYFENQSLYIEDTGIGISKSDLPRVTEMGYTGYNGRINEKSTGIGLYLVKQISQELSLNLKIESEISKGTKVSIHFPKEQIMLGNNRYVTKK